ncbi:MAG: hypothetical protein PHD48_08940 [Alphaproteobacteria bacterium]|nr:hypothetical protein [Alphaproteobacteria bacterium]
MTVQKQSPLAKQREERAAEAMRENLRRRKQQQQARAHSLKDSAPPHKED